MPEKSVLNSQAIGQAAASWPRRRVVEKLMRTSAINYNLMATAWNDCRWESFAHYHREQSTVLRQLIKEMNLFFKGMDDAVRKRPTGREQATPPDDQ